VRYVALALLLVACGKEPVDWRSADHEGRTRLAYEWLRRPGNTVGTILDAPARESEPMPDGGVRLRFWVHVPNATTGGRYIQREAVFDAQGRVVGGRDLAIRDQRP
jgi:hypothetical protein